MQLSYDSQTCTRCAGSGHYSYNQINGTTCFGCNGSGQKDSKRGAATRTFMNNLLTMNVSDLPIGVRFTIPNMYQGIYSVAAISDPVQSGWSQSGDGPKIPSYRVTITTGKGLTIGLSLSGTVRR